MMNSKAFKTKCCEMVDYIVDYRESLSEIPVIPEVEPGFMKSEVPLKAPKHGESWEKIIEDTSRFIMPNLTHWLHPQFHAYFPLGASYASVLGSMLSGAINCSGARWSESPACTELEIVVLDWLGKLIALPSKFLFCTDGKGGGVAQGSASEGVLMALFAARRLAVQKLKDRNPDADEGSLLSSLTAYTSKEAHACVEKAAMIALVNIRILEADEKFRFRGATLEEAIKKDLEEGYHPFFAVATFCTTASASCDQFNELGTVCQEYGIWLHIDAAFGGSALVCPEIRRFSDGFEYASSITTNPYKWLLTNPELSVLWVDDRLRFAKALAVNPSSITNNPDEIIDFYHWGIADSRRFRALKLWFVLRSYGLSGIQKYIRNHMFLAKEFEKLVRADDRFEVLNEVNFSLVCFRINDSNRATSKLLAAIIKSRKLFMVPALLKGKYVIRFSVDCENATENQIQYSWSIIQNFANELNLAPDE